MIYVPAGEFLMGSTDAEVQEAIAECVSALADESKCESLHSREAPQHTVYLNTFWIDKTEVTNAKYRKCVDAGACQEPDAWDDTQFNAPNQPVVRVSWFDAETYAAWVGGRLPTEAEWEKAARGTDGREYPWGNTFDGSRVNFCDRNCGYEWKDQSADDGYTRTAPVGSYPAGASPYGALDMAGNVFEWVADWFDAGYYSESPSNNPPGPASGENRVAHGGGWTMTGGVARCAFRSMFLPDTRSSFIGFRVVMEVGPSEP